MVQRRSQPASGEGGGGLTRRQLASTAGAALLARWAPTEWWHPTGAAAASSGANLSEIAGGVFVHRGVHGVYTPENIGDISNCGFIVGRDAVAVIDTGGTALFGARLREAVRTVTNRPIGYVINTHMHPDHVLGNAAFRSDNTAFVGHHKLAAALAARAERYLAYNRAEVGEAGFAGTEIVLPTQAVETTRDIDLGGRVITLEAQRTAHTDNDLTVRDHATGTVFMGDLVFAEHVPTIDGSIRGWIALLEGLSKVPAARIVPGHGPVQMPWPSAAEPLQRYLDAVARDVRKAIRDGRTLSEAVASAAQEERGHWELFDRYHARNVSAAFAELEWE